MRVCGECGGRDAVGGVKLLALPTVKIDLSGRVRALVRLILRRLNDPGAPAFVETLQTRLVVRGTVG